MNAEGFAMIWLRALAGAVLLILTSPALALAAAPVLSLPMACTVGKTCAVQHYVDLDPGPAVLDYRCQHRTYDKHNGIDIRLMTMAAQRTGVAVLAAAPGRVARLRDGVADISIRAAGAPSIAGQECGNGAVIDHGDGWETQYCHLARGSVSAKVGDIVKAGQPIARVGLSGDTEFPHLHFTVRHGADIVDPFAPVAARQCAPQKPLWDAAAARQLTYKAGEILNAGWADRAVTEAEIGDSERATPGPASPYLVSYVRLIGLAGGDEVEMILTGPGGAVLAQTRKPPLDRDKDTWFGFVGKRMPPAGWPRGAYRGLFQVHRAGRVVISREIGLTL